MDCLELVGRCQSLLERWGKKDKDKHNVGRVVKWGQVGLGGDQVVPWSWTLLNLFQLLVEYSSGLTDMVLNSELEVLWDETVKALGSGTCSNTSTSLEAQLRSQPLGSLVMLDDFNYFDLTVQGVQKLQGSSFDILMVQDRSSSKEGRSSSEQQTKYRFECMLLSKFQPLLNQGVFNNSTIKPNPFPVPMLRLAGGVQLKIISDTQGRLLPTPNVMFELPGRLPQFQSIFGKEACLNLSVINKAFFEDPARNQTYGSFQCGIWLQIGHLDSPTKNSDNVNYQRVIVGDGLHVTTLKFNETQIPLVSTLRTGDFIGLWHPKLVFSSREAILPTIEVSDLTLLFYSKFDASSSVDSSVFKDQTFRATRLKLSEISPGFTNISLPVRLISYTRNIPLESNGNKMNRCTLVVEDESGVANVTFWGDSVCSTIAECLPGHLLLLHNLSCPEVALQAEPGNKLFINAIPSEGFELINMNTVKGILNTNSVRVCVPFCEIATWLQSASDINSRILVGNCTVVDCIPVVIDGSDQDENKLSVQCHRHCRQPVKSYIAGQLLGEQRRIILGDYMANAVEKIYFCEFCQVMISQYDMSTEIDRCFSLAWLLDDGSARLLCFGFWKASLDFLDVSPEELLYSENSRQPVNLPPKSWSNLLPNQVNYTVPASFRTPLAAQTLIGTRFWVTVSQTPTVVSLPPEMKPGFPLPRELGFNYQVDMAIPSKAIPASSRLLDFLKN